MADPAFLDTKSGKRFSVTARQQWRQMDVLAAEERSAWRMGDRLGAASRETQTLQVDGGFLHSSTRDGACELTKLESDVGDGSWTPGGWQWRTRLLVSTKSTNSLNRARAAAIRVVRLLCTKARR
jgi:hypothetical protein